MTEDFVAPEYVAARRALLDVLELLEAQRIGLVLVGAQAVYLRAPSGRARRITYTTDGDLVLDPDLLAEDPDIGQLLLDAGYRRGSNPGAFLAPNGIEIDLMVPEGMLPASSRRSADLVGQSRFTARRTAGVELALVDSTPMPVAALEDADHRLMNIRVAGPAALTVAKLVKIEERVRGSRRDRIVSKDASDLLRLFRYCGAEAIGLRLGELTANQSAAPVIDRAMAFLRADLSERTSSLVTLAVEDRSSDETERQVADAMRTLGERLLGVL